MDRDCYRSPVACFLTICAYQKFCLFGRMENHAVVLTELGIRIEQIWLDIGKNNANVDVSNYVVMPNHFHGVINLKNSDASDEECESIYDLIRDFKSFTTHEFNRMRNMKGVSLWQRGYYDHIVRDDNEYGTIKRYIASNPAKWVRDRFYMEE